MKEEIVNKVASSGLVTINLEELYPKGERVIFDLKDFLYEGLILKEKDYRTALKEYNWNIFQDKYVALTCSADAIVPTWAFILAATKLQPYAKKIVFGDLPVLETAIFRDVLGQLNLEVYKNQRVVIKGCSDLPVPIGAYIELSNLLQPVVKSMMYGEPCSTVPLYKSVD